MLGALLKPDFLRLLERLHGEDRRLWLIVLLHFWHAGRASEILALTRDNFVGSHIKFKRKKGSKDCDQELVSHGNPFLDEYSGVHAHLANLGPNQKLFNLSRWTYLRHFRRHALAAGIDPAILHRNGTRALKHSICTYMYEKAAPNEVQRRAGHVNGANTLKYGEKSESAVDQIVKSAVGL